MFWFFSVCFLHVAWVWWLAPWSYIIIVYINIKLSSLLSKKIIIMLDADWCRVPPPPQTIKRVLFYSFIDNHPKPFWGSEIFIVSFMFFSFCSFTFLSISMAFTELSKGLSCFRQRVLNVCSYLLARIVCTQTESLQSTPSQRIFHYEPSKQFDYSESRLLQSLLRFPGLKAQKLGFCMVCVPSICLFSKGTSCFSGCRCRICRFHTRISPDPEHFLFRAIWTIWSGYNIHHICLAQTYPTLIPNGIAINLRCLCGKGTARLLLHAGNLGHIDVLIVGRSVVSFQVASGCHDTPCFQSSP